MKTSILLNRTELINGINSLTGERIQESSKKSSNIKTCDKIPKNKNLENESNYYQSYSEHYQKNDLLKISFILAVEASTMIPNSNLNSKNSNIQVTTTNVTETTTMNATTSSYRGRFSSPFSALSSMDFLLYSSNATTNNNNNSNYAQPSNGTSKTSMTTFASSKETKHELVHQQNYSNSLNLWSHLNNNIIHNFIPLSSTISPTIFTIKSVVNPTSQIRNSQSLVNTRHNNFDLSSSLSSTSPSSFISSCEVNLYQSKAKTTTTTTTKTLQSSTPSTITGSSLLYPSSNNNNNDIINNKFVGARKNFSSYDDDETLTDNDEQRSLDENKQRFYFNSVNLVDVEDNSQYFRIEDIEREEEAFIEPHYYQIFSRPQFKHLTLADKRRLERLFKEIDVDGNGVIDFNDLLQALEQKGIQATHENVKHLILRSDINLDGDIDFAEFVSYCLENEKQLRIIFKDIDVNDDGKIDSHELVLAFERAGIKVDEQEALRLVRRIKADSKNKNSDTLELNYAEFRDYLLLHPTDSLRDLMRSWRFGTFVDLSEDGIMPVDFSENEIKTGMWWRHMLAGGVAGAVSRTSTAPLDRLKVFLQVRGAEFNGLGVCLKHMVNEGGILSLWRGNGINVLKIAPETAMKFMTFDQLKRFIHSGDPNSEITILERFVAGSLAGAVSQTVIYPMEVLKTRFCLRQTGQYKGLWDAAQKIYSNGGIKNFYRGYVPNLIGIIPYAGIDLTIYETLKKMYMKSHSLEEAPVYVCLTCGTVSSTFGQIASYPLALIRTRMQSESGHHRSSMVDMFRTILDREGLRGLYRGITANIMKVAPAVSISYVVYEYTRRPLGAIMS